MVMNQTNLININNFPKNMAWQQKYVNQVKRILVNSSMYLISIEVASIEDDMHHAVDLNVNIKGGEVAVRIRRPDCDYRDWTIRSITKKGNKTELAKLREGFGDWYLYCWTDNKDSKVSINEWILINLHKVRNVRLLDIARDDIPNGDGTYFRKISIIELYNAKCLVTYNKLD